MRVKAALVLCSTESEFLISRGNSGENQPNKNPIVLNINAIGF